MDPIAMDRADPLSWTRDEFELPVRAEMGGQGEEEVEVGVLVFKKADTSSYSGQGPSVYLCGNSLGLMPKRARTLMQQELDVWSKR